MHITHSWAAQNHIAAPAKNSHIDVIEIEDRTSALDLEGFFPPQNTF